ncbi:Lactamase B [Geosmithia morbida]|uniref:Lactamase B n=1 Tax=Geosmithia morbida TaxID=1094350 RepID=A0A9P5D304_9HYPO|nr:Lactamase B [Geosmithia morbida]KAF4122026.1 Lactamase B [Geosmithia morbida]
MAKYTTTKEYDEKTASSWLICRTCGTQFPSSDRNSTRTCHICDDARQFVPQTGQSFTTLDELRRDGHANVFTPYHYKTRAGTSSSTGNDESDAEIIFIETQPKVGIGQRAALIRTQGGNVLWDCLTLLDDETTCRVRGLGGIDAMVISHPHYYTTHAQWARTFGCRVYVASEDECWATMPCARRVGLTRTATDVLEGVTAIKLGGHFPGSMVLLSGGHLFVADTLVTTPSGMGDWSVDGAGRARGRPPGMNTFAFMWSIPNMIPLRAEELVRMWGVLRGYEFRATHGAFAGTDIEDGEIRERVRESMAIQAASMGDGALGFSYEGGR